MAEAHGSLGISPEEFEQYQRQFIEERSEKYALLEKVRKLEQDLAKITSEKHAEKDFDKLIKDKFQKPFQSLLSRTKRDSVSTELVIQQENDALQERLHSQEDDFQRQNVLLMQELQHLAVKNEDLERKLKSPEFQNFVDSAKRDQFEAKIRSLEAELTAFRNFSLSGGSLTGSGDAVDGDGRVMSDDGRLLLEVAAATEEIRMLKEQMEANRKSYEAVAADQERTVANLIRDLEGKQSSVQLLLSERDQLQRSNKDLISTAAVEREKLLASWKLERSKTLEEKHQLRQAFEEETVISKTRTEDVERQMKDLLEQMDVTGQQTKRDSDELLREHKLQITSLLHEVEGLAARNAALAQSESELRQLVTTLQAERTKLMEDEGEMSRLAEKRKATIDDLTAHLMSVKQQHEEIVEKSEIVAKRSIVLLNGELNRALTEAAKVAKLEAELETVQTKLRYSLAEQDTLTADVKHYSGLLDKERSSRAEESAAARNLLTHIQGESTSVKQVLSHQVNLLTTERDDLTKELSTTVSGLERQLADRTEEVKIIERKNAGVARDLQKQLQSEKKHVEKLQGKLNELLRDGSLKLKLPDTDAADFTERDETGSVSSWSFVSSKSAARKAAHHPDSTSNHSNTETETGLASSMTEQEVRDLVTRITKLQQEKAGLVERVSMLETGNAAMAQDLMSKSAVIDRYLQATPVLGHHGQVSSKEADAFSLRSLIDRLGRDKTMDVEMQKNLRHLLEETLTKNVHLQKNMELLTEELDRLRGSTPPRF